MQAVTFVIIFCRMTHHSNVPNTHATATAPTFTWTSVKASSSQVLASVSFFLVSLLQY